MNNERQRNVVIAAARAVCNHSGYGGSNLQEAYGRLEKSLDELDEALKEQACNPKPKGLPNRLLYESDTGPFCNVCGSSFKKKYLFWKHTGCIQSKCVNYYGYCDKGVSNL